jgi:hypothetical protein
MITWTRAAADILSLLREHLEVLEGREACGDERDLEEEEATKELINFQGIIMDNQKTSLGGTCSLQFSIVNDIVDAWIDRHGRTNDIKLFMIESGLVSEFNPLTSPLTAQLRSGSNYWRYYGKYYW